MLTCFASLAMTSIIMFIDIDISKRITISKCGNDQVSSPVWGTGLRQIGQQKMTLGCIALLLGNVSDCRLAWVTADDFNVWWGQRSFKYNPANWPAICDGRWYWFGWKAPYGTHAVFSWHYWLHCLLLLPVSHIFIHCVLRCWCGAGASQHWFGMIVNGLLLQLYSLKLFAKTLIGVVQNS